MPNVAIQAASAFFTYFSYLSKVLTNFTSENMQICAQLWHNFSDFFAQLLPYISRNFWIF